MIFSVAVEMKLIIYLIIVIQYKKHPVHQNHNDLLHRM